MTIWEHYWKVIQKILLPVGVILSLLATIDKIVVLFDKSSLAPYIILTLAFLLIETYLITIRWFAFEYIESQIATHGGKHEKIKKYTYSKKIRNSVLLLIYLCPVIYCTSITYDLTKLSELKKQELRDHIIIGNFLLQREEYQNAIEEFYKALKIDPKNKEAKKNIEIAKEALKENDLSNKKKITYEDVFDFRDKSEIGDKSQNLQQDISIYSISFQRKMFANSKYNNSFELQDSKEQKRYPLSKDDIVTLIKQGLSTGALKELLDKRGINFELNHFTIIELKSAGVSNDIIEHLKNQIAPIVINFENYFPNKLEINFSIYNASQTNSVEITKIEIKKLKYRFRIIQYAPPSIIERIMIAYNPLDDSRAYFREDKHYVIQPILTNKTILIKPNDAQSFTILIDIDRNDIDRFNPYDFILSQLTISYYNINNRKATTLMSENLIYLWFDKSGNHNSTMFTFNNWKNLMEDNVKIAIINALSKMEDQRANESLIYCGLSDSSYSVRKAAISTLAEIHEKRAVMSLIEMLNDIDNYNILPIPDALGKLGDKRAVEPLIKLLRIPQINKISVIKSLGKLKDKRAVKPLIDELEKIKNKDQFENGDYAIIESVQRALGEIADKRAYESLIYGLEHYSTKGKEGSLLYAYTSDIEESAIWALGELRDNRAVKLIIKRLQSPHEYIRYCAVDALIKINYRSTTQALIQTFRDKKFNWLHDEYVVTQILVNITNHLIEIKDKRYILPLIEELKSLTNKTEIHKLNRYLEKELAKKGASPRYSVRIINQYIPGTIFLINKILESTTDKNIGYNLSYRKLIFDSHNSINESLKLAKRWISWWEKEK